MPDAINHFKLERTPNAHTDASGNIILDAPITVLNAAIGPSVREFPDFDKPNPDFYYRLTGYTDAGVEFSYNIVSISDANPQWAKRIGGIGLDFGLSVAVDGSGNVILAGRFTGTVDFGGGPLTSAGGYDIFVAKYTPAGVFTWAKKLGGTGDDSVRNIAQDANGNIFLSGSFPGGSIVKLSSIGDLIWTKGPVGTVSVLGIACDSTGAVVSTGSFIATFQNQMNFGDGHTLYSAGGSTDAFVVKYSSAGVCQWAKSFANYGGLEEGTCAAIVSGNGIIVSGWAQSGGFSLDGTNYLPDAGGWLAKFDTDGNHVWSRSVGINGAARIFGMALDPVGNIGVAGYFANQHTELGGQVGDAGSSLITGTALNVDAFLARYSSAGAFQWGRAVQGNNYERLNGMAADAVGNFIIVGNFRGSANFGNQTLVSSSVADNGYVAKYTNAGAPVWAKILTSQSDDYNGTSLTAVAADNQGKVIVTGGFYNSTTFNGFSLTSVGSIDGILARINP